MTYETNLLKHYLDQGIYDEILYFYNFILILYLQIILSGVACFLSAWVLTAVPRYCLEGESSASLLSIEFFENSEE